MGIPIPRDEKAERLAARIRAVEEKIVEVYPTDVMQTPVHLSLGQEAVAAAVCSHLNKDDLKIGTHRGHALYIANGGDLVKFFGELLGRQCGCSGGRGGSMHLTDPEHGLVGTTSIVGGCLPIACGLAMSAERPRIVACFFGDGACDQGVADESFRFAALHSLPILFVCSDNGISVDTPLSSRRPNQHWTPPQFAYTNVGMHGREYMGGDLYHLPITQDAGELGRVVGVDVEHMRKHCEPHFVWCHVRRCYGHQGVEKEAEPPPIDVPQELRDEVEAAYQEALKSPKAAWNG